MTRKIDLAFCGLLALAALGHLFGTFKFTDFGSGLFVWSLSGVLACALVVVLNVLRVLRRTDVAITWLALSSSLAWLGIVFLFGQSIGNFLDFRVLFHGCASLGLCVMSAYALKSMARAA